MAPLSLLLLLACWQACLQKAIAGPTKKRLRDEASDTSEEFPDYAMGLYGRNILPGTLAKRNLEKATSAGAQGCKLKGKKGGKNAARTLRRAFKKTLWPQLYWCQIPMKSKKNNKKALMWHAFQLPHEWMAVFFADPAALARCQPAQGSKTWVAAKEIKQKLGWGDEAVIPFALHGDGVPVQGTMRKEGLDFLTINLPAAQDAKHRSPVPFTLLQNDSHWEYDTKDSILKVLLWSMQCLKEGKFPSCRHDGSPWLKSDKQRRTYVGRDLPAKGILVEIRGDWDWLNSWYNIPTYNTKSGMCWLCKATFETFRNSTANERGSDHEVACHRLAKFLAKVYNKVETNEHSGLHKASAKVTSQYLALEKEALEAEDSLNWHVMPKLHQGFLVLCR